MYKFISIIPSCIKSAPAKPSPYIPQTRKLDVLAVIYS